MKNQNDIIFTIVAILICAIVVGVSFGTKKEPIQPPAPAPVTTSDPVMPTAVQPVMTNGLGGGSATGGPGGGGGGMVGGGGGAPGIPGGPNKGKSAGGLSTTPAG